MGIPAIGDFVRPKGNIYLCFSGTFTDEGKETQQLPKCGIIHCRLRLSGNERREEMAATDMIMEFL